MVDTTRYTNDPALAVEYVRFMQLKFVEKDFDATKLSPSVAVDSVWHRHILNTRAYASDCMALYGKVIHHNPDGADDDCELIERRYQKTLAVYKQTFGEEAPEAYWPRRTHEQYDTRLIIAKLTGDAVRITVNGAMTIRELKEALHIQHAFPTADEQRLLADGAALQDTARVFAVCLDQNGEQSAVIQMYPRMRGC